MSNPASALVLDLVFQLQTRGIPPADVLRFEPVQQDKEEMSSPDKLNLEVARLLRKLDSVSVNSGLETAIGRPRRFPLGILENPPATCITEGSFALRYPMMSPLPEVEVENTDVSAALNDALSHATSHDWDGYGAQPFNTQSSQYAARFLQVQPIGVPLPEISVDPDGEVCFEWYKAPNQVFSVSFGPTGRLTYAGLFEGNDTHGTEVFEDEIPEPVLESIRRILS